MQRAVKRLALPILLVLGGPAAAQSIPPLADVPGAGQGELLQQRAQLLRERNTLHERVNAHDARCSAVDKASPQWSACFAERSALAAELRDHVGRSNRFNEEVRALLDAPSPFDSRSLVTRSEYDEAVRREAALFRQQQAIAAELAKLKIWQGNLQADDEEFRRIQADAQIDTLHDVLANIPAGDLFRRLAALKYLTAVQAGTLSAGYDALKGALAASEGVQAQRAPEQVEKILAAQQSLRQAMLDPALAKLRASSLPADQASLHWLENLGKTLKAGKEIVVFSQQADRSWQAYGKLAVKLCVVAEPVAAYGVILETVGEKKLAQAIVRQPLARLDEALSANFNAQRYLADKRDSIDAALAAVRETQAKYRAVHTDDNPFAPRP